MSSPTRPTPHAVIAMLSPDERAAYLAEHGDRDVALATNRFLLELLAIAPPDGYAPAYLTLVKGVARDVACALFAHFLKETP